MTKANDDSMLIELNKRHKETMEKWKKKLAEQEKKEKSGKKPRK